MRGSYFLKRLVLVAGFCLLAAGTAFAQAYPQLDISGYKKWEYKDVKVSPIKNYFAGLTHLGGFYPTFTGGPWQERLQLRIMGQLSKELSVTYDLEQQPETPDRYDVKVKYLNNELTFGDFTANFSGNEFASTSKFLNGVMLTAKDNWYDVILVPSAKLKSQTQKLTSQKGNNTKGPYNLGHGSIIEGSERVELNGNPLQRNVDYIIDYFEGNLTFNRILTQADEFKYTYEYTNILDLFFPALSKRDFIGFQSRLTIDPEEFGKPAPKAEPVIESFRETFPSTGTLEPEILEEEASGRYRLKKIPIVRFTEKLTFMGTELRKDEDYIIRYDRGQIKLLTRFLPTSQEALTVEYQYYQTSSESETLPGIRSRGPYRLMHKNIVPDSERIEVDGKLFIRDLDYSIAYETGEIVFGIVIGTTSQIKASYRYRLMLLPTLAPSKFPKELKIGTTFLKESAKAGGVENTATDIETRTGQSIIDDEYHLYLGNRPVVSTGEGYYLLLKVNETVLTPGVDFVFPETVFDPATGNYIVSPEAKLAYRNDPSDPSDGYRTGTIKFIQTALITPTSEVTATYGYYKSVVGRYSGVGDGTKGHYYLRNIRNIVPGTETVQVWEQGSSVITTYTRNSSFEADAGDTGYTINYDADNPYLLFNQELDTSKNFQIIYQYVPPTGFQSRDISQWVWGVDGSFKIGEIFKIETAYARSSIDRVIRQVATSESFNGDGGKRYALHSPEQAAIIEDSEQVYVNDQLLNKDVDYFISYTGGGQITFYYISPAPQDAIRVDYNYQDPEAAEAEIREQPGNAYRLGAETRLLGDTLTLSGTTKKIDYDFTPMGGTSIGLGSKYLEYNLKYNPDFHSFFTDYSYKENHNPLPNQEDKFLKSYDHSVSAGINPGEAVKFDVGYRKYWAIDDSLSPGAERTGDSSQETYSISMIPAEWTRGLLSFGQKYDLKETKVVNDYLRDSDKYSETKTFFRHANGTLKFTERFTAGYDFQQSEPKTVSLKTSTLEATTEALSSHILTTDTSYNFTFDLTFGPFHKLATRVSVANQENKIMVRNFLITDEAQTVVNETYHLDFIPVVTLSTAYDRNRQERSTSVWAGTNPKNERDTFSVKFTPFSFISTDLNKTESASFQESGARTSGTANNYSADITPYSTDRIKFDSKYTFSDSTQKSKTATATAEETTDTDSVTQDYTLSLTPHPIIPLTLSYSQRDYKNYRISLTSPISTETQEQTIQAALTFSPTQTFDLSASWSQKKTKDLVGKKESPKVVLGAKVTYRPYTWGAFVIDYQDEDNKGEVQAGKLPSLDIKKTTITYSVNINLPVDNPVLTSFVLTGSLKSVDYKDRLASTNDFYASLATIEGTLNF